MAERSTPTQAFTKRSVEALPTPPKGRVYHYDARAHGLTVCVTEHGRKTWYFCRRIRGKYERIRLGAFPEVTVEQAREAAERLVGEVVNGRNPAVMRRRSRHSIPVSDLFESFLAAPARLREKRTRSPQTERNYRSRYANAVALLADRRIADVTRADVEKWHDELGRTRGKQAANKSLDLLRAMFEHAIDTGLIDNNPAKRVRMFASHSRDRFLGAHELPAFLKALEDQPQIARDWVTVALFTAARRSDVDAMRWADLDLTAGIWTIPTSKTGRQTVPLIGPVLDVLRARVANRGDCEYVFPPTRPPRRFWTMQYGRWNALRIKAGVPDLTVHDLRRSLASWMAMGGASLPIVGRALGHSQPSTTAVYARLADGPVRDAMQSAADAILRASKIALDATGKKPTQDTIEAS